MNTKKLTGAIQALTNILAMAVAEQLAKSSVPIVQDGRTVGHISKAAVKANDTPRRPRTEKQMRCRFPHCKARSKGPRFHYLCPRHLKRRHLKAWRRPAATARSAVSLAHTRATRPSASAAGGRGAKDAAS